MKREMSKKRYLEFIINLKANANLYAYQNNVFSVYDLYKTCLNHAVELGNKTLIAEEQL